MSGTSRSAVHSSASGRIKTENPALVKLLTGDSLTDTTRFVASEHNSPDCKQHASTNLASVDTINNSSSNPLNNPEETSEENRPDSRYSDKNNSEKVNIDKRPDSRYSGKYSPEIIGTEKRPDSKYSVRNSPEKVNTDKRPDSRYSGKNSPELVGTEKRPNSRYSVKSEKVKGQGDHSNHSSWGNEDETLTFDVDNLSKVENQDFDKLSQNSHNSTKKNIENIIYSDSLDENKYKLEDTGKVPSSNISGHNSPSKIDYLKVEKVKSPTFERAHSREEKASSRTSQSFSYHRLKNSSTSASQEHPSKVARSVSQIFDAQGGDGFETDSLDIDSGLVPDTTSYLETAHDTGRDTYRVPTPVSKNVPVIKSADSSRFRSDSRTSQRSGYSATGVALPQLDRTESLVSDNGIPPPSNIQYNLPSSNIEEVEENLESTSPSRRVDQRKSAVSFKEPVITNYHSHIEGRDSDNWDTPRERVPTPHPTSPKKFQDSLDFENNGRTSNLSPEPTHDLDSEIPSAFYSEPVTNTNSSAKSGSGRALKKVYVDSPTFTREEEDEYRFVESRLEEMNDELEDTVRRIEEKGDRYRQEREAMNEEAARLRAEIQATEGYSNSYNSRNTSDRYRQSDNYSDNYSKPITHPSDEMESTSYGRQDQESDYRQDRYSDNSRNYRNVRDSRDVYNDRNENRYEDRNIDDRNNYNQDGYSRNPGGNDGYSRNRGGNAQNGYGHKQDEQYDRRQNDQYQRQDDQYSRRQNDQYARQQDNQYSERQDNQYSRRQDDQYYDRRGESPSRFQNGDDRADNDLQRETEYQEDLRHRIESNQQHDSEVVIPRIPLDEDQFRDSLDENGYNDQRNYVRDSLEPDGYGNWGNPPPNPFGQGHGDNEGYLKEERPAYVDENDTARMELLHPVPPRVDYVEENKFTYGLAVSKSYKNIKIKEKEAEQKLNEIFIHPKKQNKKHKRTIPLSNEERRPPLSEMAANNHDNDGAEGVWAKRSAQLAKHKDGKQKTGSGSIKKSRGLQKYPSDSGSQQSNQGQIRPGQGRMYGTPTRNQYLEPIGYKPQMSRDEPMQSPVYRDGSYKKPMELEPIKTEITTDDGQKISVDINLKVLSPTLQRRIRSHPDDAPQSDAPFNVHAEVKQKGDRRPTGVQYQPAYRDQNSENLSQPSDSRIQNTRQSPQNSQQNGRQYQDNRPYQDQPQQPQQQQRDDYRQYPTENRVNGYEGVDEEELRRQEEALMAELNLSPNPYTKIPPIPMREELNVPSIMEKGGYASMYADNKTKDQNREPWYQVYTLNDYKKMQKEVRLNRGTLGPDLDTETYKDKLEKRHKQFEYARMVMEKNKQELHNEKKPNFPRKDPQTEESEKSKRKAKIPADKLKDPYFITSKTLKKAALDYARNVPKPAVKSKPNQYNSYEVASQMSPIMKQGSQTSSRSPTHNTQNMDVIDLKKLQQRHEQEKKNVAMMRQNINEPVPQKA